MSEASTPAEFLFPSDIQGRGYRVFPDALEDDPLTAFHGTAEENFWSILRQGFKFKGALQSCSFAKSSPLALGYGCAKRSEASPNGCVMAVRFKSWDDVVEESSVIHVYRHDRMPEVIGYCLVPATYTHV